MPELPEVEAARRAVEEHCLGKKIKKAIIANDTKVIDSVSSSDFEAALLGKTIISAHRKGKNLWLHLDSPPFPSFQFGMSGAIYIKGVAVTKYKRSAVNDTDEWPSKYSKFFIELDDGLELSFTDKRRFAKVRLLKDPAAVSPISELGPDALLEPMTVDEFTELLSKKKIAIKALLLDQSYIAGIGNWIADEVLYQARIHPLQSCASMSKENCATLHKCIKEVIQYAVRVDADSSRFPLEWIFHFRWDKKPGKVNGKILLLYVIILTEELILQVIEKAIEVGADSSQFPKNWIFHSREKKSGAFVDGKKIDFINAGGRTTAYVPELQKLSGNQAAKVAAEPRKKTSKRKRGGNDDTDELSNEEEKIVETDQLKEGPKPRGRGKKPPMKRKSDDSDDDMAGDDNSDDDEVQKKTMKKTTTKQAKAEKASKKKVPSSQNSKKPKKAK